MTQSPNTMLKNFQSFLDELSKDKNAYANVCMCISFTYALENYRRSDDAEITRQGDNVMKIFEAAQDFAKSKKFREWSYTLVNIYGHMLQKHKYDKDYESIKKQFPIFCRNLSKMITGEHANLIEDIKKHNGDMLDGICFFIDKLLKV